MIPRKSDLAIAVGVAFLFAFAVTSNAYDAAREWCRRKRKEVDQCPR